VAREAPVTHSLTRSRFHTLWFSSAVLLTMLSSLPPALLLQH
jgi:hypothetical protein